MLTGDAAYGAIGGESVQHVLLARAWRDLGLDVSIVVHDYGQPRNIEIDGIRAISAFPKHGGTRVLRFLHPRMTGLVRAMRDADADVYYQSPAAPWSGVAVWFAQRKARRSVLRLASDSDCMRGRQPLQYRRDRWFFDYALRHASLIAAQTERQRELLAQNYGVGSEILNMAVDAVEAPAAPKDVDVLWVGNLRPVKRPDILLELARRLPRYRFALVGGAMPRAQAYYDRIALEAQSLPNVLMTGGVGYNEVGGWFDRAHLHVNTSDYEGFPNTYLQAWIRGLPVVSFFDPDALIERRALGRRCSGLEQMCSALEQLLGDARERAAVGERARTFVSAQYSAREVARRYLELLERPNTAPLPLGEGAVRAVRGL
jgi:glycosyltransferase involved in cell wall biosynthesis